MQETLHWQWIRALSSGKAYCVNQNSRQPAGGRVEGTGTGQRPINGPIVSHGGTKKRPPADDVSADGRCWTQFCPGKHSLS